MHLGEPGPARTGWRILLWIGMAAALDFIYAGKPAPEPKPGAPKLELR